MHGKDQSPAGRNAAFYGSLILAVFTASYLGVSLSMPPYRSREWMPIAVAICSLLVSLIVVLRTGGAERSASHGQPPPFRFSLRDLLWSMVVLALLLTLWRSNRETETERRARSELELREAMRLTAMRRVEGMHGHRRDPQAAHHPPPSSQTRKSAAESRGQATLEVSGK